MPGLKAGGWMARTAVVVLAFNAAKFADAQEFPQDCSRDSQGWNVAMAQSLINELNGNSQLTVDGIFGPETETGVRKFQEASPALEVTGVIDQETWAVLFQNRKRYLVTFENGNTTADDPVSDQVESLYDAVVTVEKFSPSGRIVVGRFRGSVGPDDINTSGRINDGWYTLQLGFHNRSRQRDDGSREYFTPSEADLVVKITGQLRPCLVVNRDRDVSVTSYDSARTSADAVHVHNGSLKKRSSKGCQTILPSDWESFISIFLEDFPAFENWSRSPSGGFAYRGDEIGILIVR